MILDIAIIIVLAAAMVQGFRNGFIYTFLNMTGWLLSLVLGFVWSPHVRNFLIEKTDYYESIQQNLSTKFSSAMNTTDLFVEGFPKLLQKAVDKMAGAAANSFADVMTDFVFTILSFLAVVLLIKLILWIFIGIFSKKHSGGLTAFLDGTAGLCAGLVKGLLLVFVLLALMVPFMTLSSPHTAETIQGWLASSRFACDLYDNNLIILIIRDFII